MQYTFSVVEASTISEDCCQAGFGERFYLFVGKHLWQDLASSGKQR